jgi:hypothetical protein
MKKYRLSITGSALLTICALLFFSCQKGDPIEGAGYGTLQLSGTITSDAPLLIQIDGKTMDTLSAGRPNTLGDGILISAGDRKVQLINQEDNKPLIDTTLTIDAGKHIILPRFFYNGSAVVFDDTTATPKKDSMLVRIITLDPSLPDVMDLTISLYDFGGLNIPVSSKTFKGVRKDRFSDFITLPDPLSISPPETYFVIYAIEGYDPNNNNQKVLSIEDGTYSFVVLTDFTFFAPNTVLSLGIGPNNGGGHEPVVIFQQTK